MKRLWRILKVIGANTPLILCFAAAAYAYYLDDHEAARFFILIGAFFMCIRELSEIRTYLQVLATQDEPKGRHSGNDGTG
jgi:hypothetical protein